LRLKQCNPTNFEYPEPPGGQLRDPFQRPLDGLRVRKQGHSYDEAGSYGTGIGDIPQYLSY